MTAFIVTFAVLVVLLLTIRALLHRSRLAVGVAIGAAVALPCASLVRSVLMSQHMPVWLPAAPFALAAITLFGFGLVAWFWPED